MDVSSNLSRSTVCIALSPCFLDKLDRGLGTPATSSALWGLSFFPSTAAKSSGGLASDSSVEPLDEVVRIWHGHRAWRWNSAVPGYSQSVRLRPSRSTVEKQRMGTYDVGMHHDLLDSPQSLLFHQKIQSKPKVVPPA